MRYGHTYTRSFSLETRQHELLGLDLGEGFSRRTLIIGALLVGVWSGGLLLLFGFPGTTGFSVYFLPPVLVTYYGTRHSTRNDRRWNITMWLLAVRYWTFGHRPVINGGRRAAAPCERIPRRARWGARGDTIADSSDHPLVGMLLGRERDPATTAGAPVEVHPQPRLYGNGRGKPFRGNSAIFTGDRG